MLFRDVERSVQALGMSGRRVLVAVSAGVDSTVLAHALADLADRCDLEIAVGHVNHGLRGAESDSDEAAVRALAADRGVPLEVARVDPQALREGVSSRDRPTLQEAARTLRYRSLREMAARVGAARIATAHNADDQAETVLMRLLRGTGPDGLGGIPERSPDGVVVRPLLRVPRDAIAAFARERNLSWREDASNERDDYTRNRLRLRWLPALRDAFNPQLLRVVADLAEAQRRDSEWIDLLVERESQRRCSIEGKWLRIDGKDWGALPEALQRRLARGCLRRCGAGRLTSRTHLERMGAFLVAGRKGTAIELPGDLRLERDAAGCRLGPIRAGRDAPGF
ncbi:MAG: tRNA lysidine(34) synthetase TilS [Myxococcota bacterium]